MTDAVDELPIGTIVRWLDDSDHEREGEIVAWPDKPTHAEGVKVEVMVASTLVIIVPLRKEVEIIVRAEVRLRRIEAVARAIRSSAAGADEWDEHDDQEKEAWREHARVCIAAAKNFDLTIPNPGPEADTYETDPVNDPVGR